MVDLLPAQTMSWQFIESFARKHFRKASLEEIRTPILETTELFARGIGEGTDVVGKEMYTFLDRGDRSCTLRPEGTASVVRSILQSGLINQGPQRLWYNGPMFRYERPQAGRQRQFHQLGIELFGFDSVQSDVEVIAIGWDFLKGLGLNDLTLELNSLGTNEDRKIFRTRFVSWLEDRITFLDKDSQDRLTTNPLRILDTKNEETKKLLLDAPCLQSSLCTKSRERFEEIQATLKFLEIPFKINNELVRGLDYYSHTAFEITSDNLGSQATVCGGGRYDGLVSELGGPETPAIGWAIGMERLILLIEKELNLVNSTPDIYLINKGNQAGEYALFLSRALRQSDISVEIDHTDSTFSKQFKRAYRSGANWAIVLGDNEVVEQRFTLKSIKEKSDSNSENPLFLFSQIEKLITYLNERT